MLPGFRTSLCGPATVGPAEGRLALRSSSAEASGGSVDSTNNYDNARRGVKRREYPQTHQPGANYNLRGREVTCW